MSVGKKRKPYERKTSMRRTKQPVIDKKERKKIQNGEAARRYRDKKKNEQQLLDEELDELVEKNISLKSQVNEKENELKTLKKLMVEPRKKERRMSDSPQVCMFQRNDFL